MTNGDESMAMDEEQHAPGCAAAASPLDAYAGPCDCVYSHVRELEHLARLAGDFRDQIHPDVNWDGVPPWTMAVVRRLDKALEAFDESDD